MHKYILNLFLLIGISSQAQNLDSLESLAVLKDTSAVKASNELYRFYHNSEPKKALNYTLKALDLSLAINFKKGEAACYNNIGLFYRQQGILDKAVSYYLQSLAINEALNNAEGIAFTYNNIGTIYSLKKDYNNALKYFLDSYHILDSLGNENAMVGALNNLGNTYLAKEEDYRAIGFYKRALTIYKKSVGNNDFDPYANIGHAYFLHGELNRARGYYQHSLDDNITKENLNGMAFAYHNLAIISSVQNKVNEAIALDKRALSAAEQVLNKTLLRDIHRSLSNNYEKESKTSSAFEHLKLFVSFQELLLEEENSDKLSQMETTYLLIEKDKQLAVGTKEAELNKLRTSKRNTYIIMAVMGAMIILAGFFIKLTLKKERDKA